MRRDIVSDLAGRRNISRIETEPIDGFCGCATQLKYLNFQIMLGDASIDLGGYATVASTMLRIGSKLGLSRRKQHDAINGLGDIIRQDQEEQRQRLAEEHEQQQIEAAPLSASQSDAADSGRPRDKFHPFSVGGYRRLLVSPCTKLTEWRSAAGPRDWRLPGISR
jgi:hypothetical protein